MLPALFHTIWSTIKKKKCSAHLNRGLLERSWVFGGKPKAHVLALNAGRSWLYIYSVMTLFASAASESSATHNTSLFVCLIAHIYYEHSCSLAANPLRHSLTTCLTFTSISSNQMRPIFRRDHLFFIVARTEVDVYSLYLPLCVACAQPLVR